MLPSTSIATTTRSYSNAPSLVSSKVNTEDGAVDGVFNATISNDGKVVVLPPAKS